MFFPISFLLLVYCSDVAGFKIFAKGTDKLVSCRDNITGMLHVVQHSHPFRGTAASRTVASRSALLSLRAGASGIALSGKSKGYFLLSVTIALELLATMSMKILAQSKNKAWYAVIYGAYFTCFGLFPKVLDYLPLGIAYATWCGVGTAVTCVMTTFLFGEKMSWSKAACLISIVAGIVGLNLVEGGH